MELVIGLLVSISESSATFHLLTDVYMDHFRDYIRIWNERCDNSVRKTKTLAKTLMFSKMYVRKYHGGEIMVSPRSYFCRYVTHVAGRGTRDAVSAVTSRVADTGRRANEVSQLLGRKKLTLSFLDL
jgi:hypothetical protein